MKNTHTGVSARYLAALQAHLRRKRHDDDGDRAQGLGRAALAGGLEPRDLALMHAQAASDGFARTPIGSSAHVGVITRAGIFLSQALIPLEAAQRAMRDANGLLQQRNETLRPHAAALAKVNTRLEREVTRRQTGEAVIRKDKAQYQRRHVESQIMQRKLRQLTRQIISAQEEERKEISRELHDEVVQTLVGINVQLSAQSQGASLGLNTLKAKIARTQRLVENSVNEVHRFARELRPAALDLIPALHAYSKNLAARKKHKIHLTAFGGLEALGNAKRMVLFRVAQKSLTNVVGHAQAIQVGLSISKIPGTIRMESSDNGKAFHVDQVLLGRNHKRLGLIGMRERIEMVGGNLVVASQPGVGTTVWKEITFDAENTKT